MKILTTIYGLFRSFFDFISFKSKPVYDSLNSEEIENDYESIIFNQMRENL